MKPLVNFYIQKLVQTKWDVSVHGRDLYLVKPTLGPPKKFQLLTRAEEVVITRLVLAIPRPPNPISCPKTADWLLPKASFGLRVLSLPASVCVSVCLSVCQSLACLCDNSGPVQARIAKFGPKMQKTLVKVPIVFGGQLTLTYKVKFNFKVRIHPF